jgi:hypothetical protein
MKMAYPKLLRRGYIALITIIIICSILSIITFSASTRSILERISENNSENKEASRILADSCAYRAIGYYIQDSSYSPSNQTIQLFPGKNCTILSLTMQNSLLYIQTIGNISDSYTQMNITAQETAQSIIPISWAEITGR